jgi:RNA methyltransferase, TrmH family
VEFVVPLETLAERYDRLTWHDPQGQPVATPTSRGFNCYIYSNEGRGLAREDLAKLQVQPVASAGTGAIASLNLAAAVNICQYELNRLS